MDGFEMAVGLYAECLCLIVDSTELTFFADKVSDVMSKDQSRMDGCEMAVGFYAECLSLFVDLCAGRNTYTIARLTAFPTLGLSYDGMLGAVRSKRVPFEIRRRLCDLMLALYVDR